MQFFAAEALLYLVKVKFINMVLRGFSYYSNTYLSRFCFIIYFCSLLLNCEGLSYAHGTSAKSSKPCLIGLHHHSIFPSRHIPMSHFSKQRTFLFGGGIIRGDSIPQLLKLIETSEKGLLKDNNDEIIKIINSTEIKNSQFIDNDGSLLNKINGDWELLWTTEKETLFFIQNGLFGNAVSGIVQSINVKDEALNNLIKFKNGSEFSVKGKINVDLKERRRVNFKFTSASLLVPPFPKLSIPPIGKGWFDNVYVNDLYRLSKDIRGDYLVSKKK